MMLSAASAASRLSFWAESKQAGRAANMSLTGSDHPMMPVEQGNTWGRCNAEQEDTERQNHDDYSVRAQREKSKPANE
jgi:hypothetical protein